MVSGLKNIITILNECRVPGVKYPLGSGFNVRNVQGTSTLSVHACGRAHDVMVSDKAGGDVIASALVMASAELGIQEVIWNAKRWTSDRDWHTFSGPNKHTDHVHYSINPAASALTEATARAVLSPLLCSGGAFLGSVAGGGLTPEPSPTPFVGVPIRPVGTASAVVGTKCGQLTISGAASSPNRPEISLPVRVSVDGIVVQIVNTSSSHEYSASLFNLTPGFHTITMDIDGTQVGFGFTAISSVGVDIPVCPPEVTGSTPALIQSTFPLNVTDEEVAGLYTCDSRLGCGEYTVEIRNMGGEKVYCVPREFVSVRWNRTLDEVSTATVVLARAQCGSCIDSVNPWEHEVAIFRNDELAWAGRVSEIDYSAANGSVIIEAQDLFSWLDVRKIVRNPEGYYAECLDLAYIFQDVIASGLQPDPRPNFRLHLKPSGIRGTREYSLEQFRYAGDELRELARSGVDFTMVGRTCFAGEIEIRGGDIPYIIEEHWSQPPDVKVIGADMATRTIVGAGAAGSDGYDEYGVYPGPAGGSGEASVALLTAAGQQFGLIERSFDESAIEDDCAAVSAEQDLSVDQAARTRWEFLSSPHAYISGGRLAANAPFGTSCLIPGRRIRIGVTANLAGRPFVDLYRIQSLSVTATQDDESVSVALTPLGTFDAGAPEIRI
jgi:hypothetical protein